MPFSIPAVVTRVAVSLPVIEPPALMDVKHGLILKDLIISSICSAMMALSILSLLLVPEELVDWLEDATYGMSHVALPKN